MNLGVHTDRAGIAKIEIGIRCVCDYEILILAKALHVAVTWLLPVRTALRREALTVTHPPRHACRS